MMSCREVTGLVASDELAEAPWARRLVVRLHLFMRSHCRRYAQHGQLAVAGLLGMSAFMK